MYGNILQYIAHVIKLLLKCKTFCDIDIAGPNIVAIC